MTKSRSEAAAAARLAAEVGGRKRAELFGLMRPAFALAIVILADALADGVRLDFVC